jgi:hypothetical protein
MGGEMPFKFFYKPFHYTSRLVLYKLDNKSPIFFNDHKHKSNIGTCFMHHKKMPIELKYNIFALGLWLQMPHPMENITSILHQIIEHLKLKVIIIPQQVHMHLHTNQQ